MKSLSTRLALVISSVLLGLMTIAGLWVERQLTQIIHQEEINQAQVHAKTLLASLQTLMLNGQGTLAREWLDRMHGEEGIIDIGILRVDGREAFTDTSTVDEVNQYLGQPRFQRQPVLSHRRSITDKNLLEQAKRGTTVFDESVPNAMTVLMPIKADTACLSCHGYDASPLRGILKLSLSREASEERLNDMKLKLWFIAALLVLILAVAMWTALQFSVLRPVAILRAAIKRVGQGDLNAKLPVQWRDELGDVAIVFNQMQKELRAKEARIRSVMDNVIDAIIIIDQKGIIDSVNPMVTTVFGYSPQELLSMNVNMLMPEPYKSMHDRYLANYLETGKAKILGKPGIEVMGVRKDGSIFPLEIGLSEMKLDDNRRYFIGMARDITQRKEQMAAIEHQALHDALTDLPNRVLLSDRLQQAVLRAQRSGGQFALLLMDLDRFKEINDTLGHHFGDVVLKQVAHRMHSTLRESDTISRLGGDEFAVLLIRADAELAKQVALKLLHVLDLPFVIEGQTLHIGASIGIALFPDHGRDEVTLMRLADVAMYMAKRGNQGVAVYDPSKDEHTLRNLALVSELRHAINSEQLLLHYQPKIDVATGKVCGVEALVRWQHSKHGLMYPDEFIELAEQTGLIMPLTLWVLDKALTQTNEWRKAGIGLEMSVNMSVRNLQDGQFPERMAKIMESCKHECHLWLEITETAIMADQERAQEILAALHNMNIRLSIDDFGTGYSSLSYLKELPVDEVKIDRSFVMGMATNENDAVIVRSTIDLAHNIGLKVTAEGVEDAAIYSLLKELGCDFVQGYYISKPLPLAELAAWLPTSPWRQDISAENSALAPGSTIEGGPSKPPV